jgi:squalene-hopene/tetraprenyl-beta-curcumene cyclase
MCEAKALRVLEKIQPQGGGFLEAAPLTSFVLMCLARCGEAHSLVAKRAQEFLVRTVRTDGSWPIDTNLETWVTTLAVNALGFSRKLDVLSDDDRENLRQWIVSRQQKGIHLYTGAAPGGWAWTGLEGGVPDADDTAGALVALHHLAHKELKIIEQGVQWLLDLQNGDGGIPTFCKGWGKLPFDRSSAELTAHAIHAMSVWKDQLGKPKKIQTAISRMMGCLKQLQRPDGSWVPLWFGNPSANAEENPLYGTAKVVFGLCQSGFVHHEITQRGLKWILENQNEDGGWGAQKGLLSSLEETGCAMMALKSAGLSNEEGERALAIRTQTGFPASAIGLYFAKLWYYEEMYPIVMTVGGLGEKL